MRLLFSVLLVLPSLLCAQEVSKPAGLDASALVRSFVIDNLRLRMCNTVGQQVSDDLIIQNRFFSITKQSAARFSFDFAWYTLMRQHSNRHQLAPACCLALKQTCVDRIQQQLAARFARLMPCKKDDPWYKKYSKTYAPAIIASSLIFVTDAYVVPKLLSLKQ